MPKSVICGENEQFQVVADWYLPDRERFLLRDAFADRVLIALADDVPGARVGLKNIARTLNEMTVQLLFSDRMVLKFLLGQVIGEFTVDQIAAEIPVDVEDVQRSLEKLRRGGFLP